MFRPVLNILIFHHLFSQLFIFLLVKVIVFSKSWLLIWLFTPHKLHNDIGTFNPQLQYFDRFFSSNFCIIIVAKMQGKLISMFDFNLKFGYLIHLFLNRIEITSPLYVSLELTYLILLIVF